MPQTMLPRLPAPPPQADGGGGDQPMASPTVGDRIASTSRSASADTGPNGDRAQGAKPPAADAGAVRPDEDVAAASDGFTLSLSGAASSNSDACIRVAVRVRPLPFDDQGIIEVIGQGTIAIRKEAATGGNEYLSSQRGRTEERSFDRVFGPTATQEEVYSWSCQPLMTAAVREGCNATVFVYGATGAGKTHTMFGERDDALQGLIYRAVREIFDTIADLSSSSSSCARQSFAPKVSFLELYNEKVCDLLQDGNTCSILEDERRGIVKISNLREVKVLSAEAALQQLHEGLQLRKVESTAANARSSRSHAVFIMQIERVEEGEERCAKPRQLHSKICLIDLAGSERASQTQNAGAALREGAKINQSLLALANCINALGERSKNEGRDSAKASQRKPPYRDSKLTLLLKSSLISGGRVSMIANVHPGRDHFEDSNNTLEYAKRTSIVKPPTLVRREPREASSSVPARKPAFSQASSPPSPALHEPGCGPRQRASTGFHSPAGPWRKPQRRSDSTGCSVRSSPSGPANGGGGAADAAAPRRPRIADGPGEEVGPAAASGVPAPPEQKLALLSGREAFNRRRGSRRIATFESIAASTDGGTYQGSSQTRSESSPPFSVVRHGSPLGRSSGLETVLNRRAWLRPQSSAGTGGEDVDSGDSGAHDPNDPRLAKSKSATATFGVARTGTFGAGLRAHSLPPQQLPPVPDAWLGSSWQGESAAEEGGQAAAIDVPDMSLCQSPASLRPMLVNASSAADREAPPPASPPRASPLLAAASPPLTPGPADREVLVSIIESLQAEKAAMDAQLRAIILDRERLIGECASLRAANLDKDRQLAALLKGQAPTPNELGGDFGGTLG